MQSIAYITNGRQHSGVGTRAQEIHRQLANDSNYAVTHFHLDGANHRVTKDGVEIIKLRPLPGVLGSKTVGWLRLGRKLRSHLSSFDVVHATNQTLSFISPSQPFVVTVHDIIELLEPQSGVGGFLSRYLYAGLAAADRIIAVSAFTADTLTEHLGIPREKIQISHNAVGDSIHPIDNFSATIGYQSLRQELRLHGSDQVVLYVGSEHPRKNLSRALAAFAATRTDISNCVFLKVGRPGLQKGRLATLEAIDRLNIRDAVRILDEVSDERLNELYNLADVLIYPSTFEGFGLPPLQAMAAGTPVIAANSTSLPEVVGDAGRLCDPEDEECLAHELTAVLADKGVQEEMREAGLTQAEKFNWQASAEVVKRAYSSAV